MFKFRFALRMFFFYLMQFFLVPFAFVVSSLVFQYEAKRLAMEEKRP